MEGQWEATVRVTTAKEEPPFVLQVARDAKDANGDRNHFDATVTIGRKFLLAQRVANVHIDLKPRFPEDVRQCQAGTLVFEAIIVDPRMTMPLSDKVACPDVNWTAKGAVLGYTITE